MLKDFKEALKKPTAEPAAGVLQEKKMFGRMSTHEKVRAAAIVPHAIVDNHFRTSKGKTCRKKVTGGYHVGHIKQPGHTEGGHHRWSTRT